MKYYGDAIATERIKNKSVCVKEGKFIRNIKDRYDFETQLLVFVDSIVPVLEEDGYEIFPNEPVRYSIVNISFR